MAGAFLTSLYTFRLIFTVFHGEEHTEAHAGHGLAYGVPLIALLVLSTGLGAMIHPPLAEVLPVLKGQAAEGERHFVEILSAGIGIAGIALAALLFLGKRTLVTGLANSAAGRFVGNWWLNAFGFDALYNAAVRAPVPVHRPPRPPRCARRHDRPAAGRRARAEPPGGAAADRQAALVRGLDRRSARCWCWVSS